MKGLFPKPLLEWKEPDAIRRFRDDHEKRVLSPWFKLGFIALIAVTVMLNWWIGSRNPDVTPIRFWVALILALLGGVFAVYGIPWMLSKCPSYIRIMDNGISRVIGNNASFWKLEDIQHCELVTLDVSGTNHVAFVIHTLKGKRTVLGLPADLSAHAQEILSELNVKITRPEQGEIPRPAPTTTGDESAK